MHFGFTASIERYAELRRRRPDVEILMGTGNLTELTDADSQGVTAMLLAICSELFIRNVLSCRSRRTPAAPMEEHDAARRLMYRAREDESLPKGYGGGLLSLHDFKPYPLTLDEIRRRGRGRQGRQFPHPGRRETACTSSIATAITSPPTRSSCFPSSASMPTARTLSIWDTNWRRPKSPSALGKRYAQDNPLDWGVAADKKSEDLIRHAPEGATLKAKTRASAKRSADAAHRGDNRYDDQTTKARPTSRPWA